EFGADVYRSYIDPLQLVAQWNGSVLFRAGTRTAQERLRHQVQARLEARLRAYEPAIGPVEILLEDEIPEDVRALADVRIEEVRAPESPPFQREAYNFDSFCKDESNHRAFTVAQMIAAGAAVQFPVWLLHSAPGCGKTHLVCSLADKARELSPNRKVLMLT